MNKWFITCIAVCLSIPPLARSGAKELQSFPIQSTGTMSKPWTVLAERDVIMATPSWNDPTASEPPLAAESAIRIAEDFISKKGFDAAVIGVRVTSCAVFSPDKWYYLVSFHPGRDNLLAEKGYDSVVVLMNGAVLEPAEGRLQAVYKR